MLNSIMLVVVIIFLIGYIIYQKITNDMLINKLTDKILSRNFIEYSNAEISKMAMKARDNKKTPPNNKIVF